MNIHDKISEAEHGPEHVRRDFEAGRDAAKALSKALNGGSRDSITLGFLDGMAREHRYLQDQTVWTLLVALAELAGPDLKDRTDARNECAIKACGLVREALKENLPLLVY